MTSRSTTTTLDLSGAKDVSETVNGSSCDGASQESELSNGTASETQTQEKTSTAEEATGIIP